MNHETPNDLKSTEDRLRKTQWKATPEASLEDNILAEYRSGTVPTVPATWKLLFVRWSLVAVVLLTTGYSVWHFFHLNNRNSRVDSGLPELYIIQTQPEAQMVSVQTLDQFETVQWKVGEALRGVTLSSIDTNSIQYTDKQGRRVRTSIENHNTSAVQSLREEVKALDRTYTAGELTAAQCSRLQAIAFFDSLPDNPALLLLEKIAGSDSPFQKEALAALGSQGPVSHLQAYANRVLYTDSPYRKTLIEGLGKIPSPVTLAALRTLIENQEEPDEIRLKALQVLRSCDGEQATQVLTVLENNPELPEFIRKQLQK